MKSIIKISMLLAFINFLFCTTIVKADDKTKTETFKVYGNCEMCQAKIEGSLKKKDGILKKTWSPTTKMLKITYDPTAINLTQIKQKIADVGYDTDEIQAKDETYNALHKCCHYERAKK